MNTFAAASRRLFADKAVARGVAWVGAVSAMSTRSIYLQLVKFRRIAVNER